MRGSLVGALSALALGAVMLPFRSHLSPATAGLVLVLPVVGGVVAGGLVAGMISVGAGFLVYDFAYLPPFGTLAVRRSEDWVALGVYVLVMAMVARVVSSLERARAGSVARAAAGRRLLEVSAALLQDLPVAELAASAAEVIRSSFGVKGVALLVPDGRQLRLTARVGEGIDDEVLSRLGPGTGRPVALSTDRSFAPVQTLALASPAGPVGLLVLASVPTDPAVRDLLPVLANQVALAVERAELHERVRRAELRGEIDRLRESLVGAVSHELRTPLASIKVASSTLLDPALSLDATDTRELHTLIDGQTDRLSRVVDGVLDMTRIRAGALEARTQPWAVADLVESLVEDLRPQFDSRPIEVVVGPGELVVSADRQLIEHVLANLLDNADRFGPPGTAVSVTACATSASEVAISVLDRGPGVPLEEREAVFDTFVRFDTGGRAGLGLAIAKAFVEAHGGRIAVDGGPAGGARFVFTLPRLEA